MATEGMLAESITPRERDILRGMVEGLTNAEIAERLVLSAGTVKWYVKQLYGKLGAHSREEAVAQALAHGLSAEPPAAGKPESNADQICLLINPLPQDVSGRYVGHAEKRARLATLFEQDTRLISIYGRAGSGKTALACIALSDLRHARRLAGPPSDPYTRQPEGVVCLSAASTGITLQRIFDDLGRLLPHDPQMVIDVISRNTDLAPAQKIRLVLEKIADRRIVLLLDNLETVQDPTTGELIEPALQQLINISMTQSSALTLLITSREPLALPRELKTWEHVISLEDGLPLDDAVALLRTYDPSGTAGLRDAPAGELHDVAGRLGGFPRALESVAGMLLEDPLLRLADIRESVDLLEGEVSAAVVRQALAHLSAEAMRVLEALAIFGRPVEYEALAYLLTPYLPAETVRHLLGRLIRACFVKANRVTQQFALHAIDQSYCYSQIPPGDADEVESTATPPFTRTALHRRAALYYHARRLPETAWRRMADLEPQLNEFQHRASAGDADGAAGVLLEIDRDYLWEWDHKDLLWQMYAILDGRVHDRRLAHQVARRQAWLKFFTAPLEADAEFARLLEESRQMGDVKEEADALDDLAQTCRRNNRDLPRGLEYHRQALALYRQLSDRRGEADALGGLGAIFTQIEPEEAIDNLLAAAEIHRGLGKLNSLSFVLSMLGVAYESLGAPDQAMASLEEAVRIGRESRSLEALSRAYAGLARLCVSTGNSARGRTWIDEITAVARELGGVPITPALMFAIGQTALYMALAGDASGGIELMERAIRDAVEFLPQVVPFGNYFLSLILMLGGDVHRARRLLPSDPGMLLSRSPNTTFWVGAILIKTGERDAAAAYLNGILAASRPSDPNRAHSPYAQAATQPTSALAHVGLALLKQDAAMAAIAAAEVRQALRVRNWQVDLLRALIGLLIQEPGGEVLSPVGEVLASIPANRLNAR